MSLPRGCACATICLLRRPYDARAWRSTIATEPVVGVHVPRERGARAAELRQWLGNPLIVALVSTLLVSLVIPKLTRQWQDHQKELEIQTALVGSMSKSASDAVISGRLLASGLYQGREWQRIYNNSIRTWSVDGSVAGANLQAYFPRSDIGAEWRAYVVVVTDYLQLAGPSSSRTAQVDQIRSLVPGLRLRWRAIAAGRGQAFQDGYRALGFELLNRRDVLIAEVLAGHPSGF